jgi:hypothetical protein
MSLFQFAACIDGHNKAHGVEEKIEPPTAAEYYDRIERLG